MKGEKSISRFLAIMALVLSSTFTIAQAQDSSSAQGCDRACLEGFMNQFLGALELRDASNLPLADDIKYTENGQTMDMDDGLWKNFTVPSSYELYVSDPQAGQIVFLGVIGENEDMIIAHFRMKVEDQEISEIEALLTRNSSMAMLSNLETPKEIYGQVLRPEQRSTREEMVAISNSYFTGLDTENSGANVPFHPDCQRQENGMILANSPDPQAGAMQKLGCKGQFDTGFSTIVTDIRERRFMVLDEEMGLSYAVIFFDHNGTAPMMGTVGGEQVAVRGTYRKPSTLMIGEMFKIIDGQIRQIEAIIVSVPYGMPSGWDGEDLITMGQL